MSELLLRMEKCIVFFSFTKNLHLSTTLVYISTVGLKVEIVVNLVVIKGLYAIKDRPNQDKQIIVHQTMTPPRLKLPVVVVFRAASLELDKAKPLAREREPCIVHRSVANILPLVLFQVSVTNTLSKPGLWKDMMLANGAEVLKRRGHPSDLSRPTSGESKVNAIDKTSLSKQWKSRNHKALSKIDEERLDQHWCHVMKTTSS